MPTFAYQAINENGHTVSGQIDAETLSAANAALAAKGYIPSKVTPTGKTRGGIGGAEGEAGRPTAGFWERLQGVKTRDLILFTQQFRTMIKAGVPILTILSVLESQTENPRLRTVIDAVHKDIQGGATLHNAFRRHPHIFSRLYCSMIQSGELSGSLPEVLERLAYIIQHEYELKSEIRSAMQYPAMVLGFLLVAFVVLLYFVIPKFAAVFQKAGIDLPLPTRICLWLYEFGATYWLFILLGFALLAGGLWAGLRTEKGKYLRDLFLLRFPVVGTLVLKASMSRFASIFSILQASGVPILQSIDILSGTIGNFAISKEFEQIKDRLQEGRGISAPLKGGKYFPPMVINMVAIGEESGNLEEMLSEISRHYDLEVEYAMKGLTEAIGPVLIVCMAAVVGLFALAIFVPMWDLTKAVM